MDNTIMSASKSMSAEAAAAKAVAACRSHSEAERRRRKRINGHFATLRTLLPNTIKTDKASLLAEVVRSVKQLKETTIELAEKSCTLQNDHHECFAIGGLGNDRNYLIPSETDELNLDYSNINGKSGTIKATLCCEDHQELIPELTRALSSIHAKVVRTEMATVGGRIKCVLWVQVSSVATRDDGLRVLHRALKAVLDRANLAVFSGNKRPRFYHN